MTAPELVALLAGLSVLFLTFAATQIAGQMAMGARMRVFVQRRPAAVPVSVRRARNESSVPLIEQFNRRLRQANFGKRIQSDLVRAGIDMPASRFLLLQGILAGVALAGIMWWVNSIPDLKGITAMVAGIAAGIAFWHIPLFYVGFMEGRRLKAFETQLPTTIDSMAGALQAGSSLTQAMEMVSREVASPMKDELAIVVREMMVGVPMQEAFGRMVERVRSLDLDMLVTAISIQHRVGGNLSQILRTISHTIRERLRIKGEISVLTAQQRLSGFIVAGLPVLIVGALFVIAPGYIMKLFEPGIARMLLVMGSLGIGAGFYALRKIADIDV